MQQRRLPLETWRRRSRHYPTRDCFHYFASSVSQHRPSSEVGLDHGLSLPWRKTTIAGSLPRNHQMKTRRMRRRNHHQMKTTTRRRRRSRWIGLASSQHRDDRERSFSMSVQRKRGHRRGSGGHQSQMNHSCPNGVAAGAPTATVDTLLLVAS